MKVHFADSHNAFASAQVFLDAGCRYMLQTFFAIEKKKYKMHYGWDVLNQFKHIIIDSGLFTIMFGAEKDTIFKQSDALAWLEKYVAWINSSLLTNASFVELDVQKKLGPDLAWDLRREFKGRINKGTVINVYHLEDGNPDRLIDYADYIAVSVPELRFHVDRKEMLKVIRYIAGRAVRKNKRVHLLGCTEKVLMKEFSFCYSCDSTSWSSGSRYGVFKSETTKQTRVENLLLASKNRYANRRQNETFAATSILLEDYKKFAGDQS